MSRPNESENIISEYCKKFDLRDLLQIFCFITIILIFICSYFGTFYSIGFAQYYINISLVFLFGVFVLSGWRL